VYVSIELAVWRICVTAVVARATIVVGLSSIVWTDQTFCLEMCGTVSVLTYNCHWNASLFHSYWVFDPHLPWRWKQQVSSECERHYTTSHSGSLKF
jgi:hypothetical protein